MEHVNDNASADAAAETLGGQLWDAIVRLYVGWLNAARARDEVAAVHAERELRFFVLNYVSLLPAAAVTTGRKAILRTIYVGIGGVETAHVRAILDLVIAREEAAARQGAQHPGFT